MSDMNIYEKLLKIQDGLEVPKTRWNSFGGYNSRSKEDVLEAVKPLAHELGCVVILNDSFIEVGGAVYITATAMLIDAKTQEEVHADGIAREPKEKPKMDSSQVTGSACSYAGKRALGNLFALDDTADADQLPSRKPDTPSAPFNASCTACGLEYRFASQEQMEQFTCGCGNKVFKVK